MAETQGTRGEQDAPSASEGDLTGASREETGLEPLAQGESRSDEIDPASTRDDTPDASMATDDVVVLVVDTEVIDADAEDADAVVMSAGDADAGETSASPLGADVSSVSDVSGVSTAGTLSLDDRSITSLNDLIHLDIDAIQAYRHAIDACEIVEIRDSLTGFMVDHERHVRDLREAVRSLGGEPAAGRDVKGFFIEGFTAIMSQGDRSALLAMRGNEELTNRCYETARTADLPEHVRPLIELNYQDEARHLAWIKEAISSRAWDAEADEKKAA